VGWDYRLVQVLVNTELDTAWMFRFWVRMGRYGGSYRCTTFLFLCLLRLGCVCVSIVYRFWSAGVALL
jgi:hypothetical protein